MKILPTILFTFAFLPAFTQTDWSPFPENQPAWYAENGAIFQYYNDSTLQTGTEKTHFFGQKYLYESFGNCTEELLTEFWDSENLDFDLNIDTLYSRPDFYFDLIENDTLKFFPNINPGESFVMPTAANDTFLISCTTATETEIFGFTDSLKTFSVQLISGGMFVAHPLNSEVILLTKSTGFLRYIPLRDFYFTEENYAVRTLQGFAKEGENYGYTSAFNDYFSYAVGNILKWRTLDRDSPDADFSGTEEWFIDTVQSINDVGNFLQLNVQRTIYTEVFEGGNLVENFTEVNIPAVFSISKVLMDSLLTTPHHHPVAFFGDLRYLRQPAEITTFGIDNFFDTITPKRFFLDDCSSEPGNNNPGTVRLNTALGLRGFTVERGAAGSYLLELLGYENEEFTWGDLTAVPFVSSTVNVTKSDFSVFPNPAAEVIHISFPQDVHNADLTVYNSVGKVVLTQKINAPGSISVAHLPSGVYNFCLAEACKKVVVLP